MQSDQQTALVEEGEKYLVLVVDDSRSQRNILRMKLKKWGYDVAEVASGKDAIAFCEATPPDIVVSDWMMPEMDGIEFCMRFKALQNEKFGYFILLTSKSETVEIAQGLDNGADDFLTKPVSSAELRARLVAGERILQMERELKRKNQLIKATLDELKTLHKLIDNDLIEARQLQQSLVRERYHDFGTARVSLLLQPSGHVGGDLVGFFPINSDEVGLFAIDVSGHGISSALMTARLAGYMSSASKDQNIAILKDGENSFKAMAPELVVGSLNDLVLREMTTEHYFTLVYAVANRNTGSVHMSQAGHPHPLLQRKSGLVESLGQGGLPVGLVPDAQYTSFEVQLERGDRLLLFSDGISECMDDSGKMFDDQGVADFLNDWSDKRGPELLDSLIFTLDRFTGGADFLDDVSAILWEYGNPKPD